MTAANGQPATSIALVTSEPPAWVETIEAYLVQRGYRFNTFKATDQGFDDLSYDAIIAINPIASIEFLRELHTRPHRPVLALITETLAGDTVHDWADLILPPTPYYVDCQLQSLLQLRAENATLQRQNQTLHGDVKNLRDQLEYQKRAMNEIEILKNAIVRNVSHELKTPLVQVKSAVALLAEDIENQELINFATGATARLETLVKNITMLGSSLDINPGPVIVRDAIEYARRNLGRIWEHRNDSDRIDIYLQEQLPPVMADKQGLSTVLQLLMDNALKFSKERVEVHVERSSDVVRINVRDYGIGIAKDHLETIFDSFYQVDSSSTRRYGGAGIGLAIVRLILDHHSSHIMVDSQEGKGSTFSFDLPPVDIPTTTSPAL